MGNRWRLAVAGRSEGIQGAWQKYGEARRKVKRVRAGTVRKSRGKRRAKLLSVGGFSSRMFWRDLREERKARLNALRIDGDVVTDTTKIREEIRQYWRKLGLQAAGNPRQSPPAVDPPLRKAEQRFDEPITGEEVEAVVSSLRAGKSAGPDEIPYELITNGGKQLAQSLAVCLLCIVMNEDMSILQKKCVIYDKIKI